MKLLFLGDFYFDYDDIPKDLATIAEYISRQGYGVILNLEGAPGEGGKPIKKRGPNLRQSSKAVDALKILNTKGVCLANNHSMDYGYEPLKNGLFTLNKVGMQCAGAGKNIDEATKPMQITGDDCKVLIQNFGWDVEETVYATKDSPGCSPLVGDYIISKTKELRMENPDAIIINVFHWGFEFNTLPMPLDIDIAHRCVDTGADLIIGHHPHVVQPMEEYRGKHIYYSLGNFYFASRRDTFTRKFENEEYKNMCDYGFGVVFDTADKSCKCIQFEYNNKLKETAISENVTCLKSINDIDWESKEYMDNAKLHSSGINPILGLDSEKNKKDINKLYFRYSVGKRMAFLKQSQFGRTIYNFLKRHSN